MIFEEPNEVFGERQVGSAYLQHADAKMVRNSDWWSSLEPLKYFVIMDPTLVAGLHQVLNARA